MNLFGVSDWTTITTSVLSVLVSIILYQRVQKKKFIYLEKQHLQLNVANFATLTDFKIIHKDDEINNYLYFISGTIIVTGDQDISPSEIHHSLCIKIQDNEGVWKRHNIIDITPLLECNLEPTGNFLNFKTNEIKSQDYIKFTAIYNAKIKGIKFYHRIIDVKSKINIVSEELKPVYLAGTILFTFLIGFILFTNFSNSNHNKVESEKEVFNFTQSAIIDLPTKEDSLRAKRYEYEELYFINNDTLKYDSILQKNRKLNNKLNKHRQTRIYKTIDSFYKNKNDANSILEKHSLKMQYLKDTVYYENDYSISEKSDSILKNLIFQNQKINKNHKYKINDTIAVSFISRKELYKQSTSTGDSFLNIFFKFFGIIVIFISFIIDFICNYNLYLLNKYKRILIPSSDI